MNKVVSKLLLAFLVYAKVTAAQKSKYGSGNDDGYSSASNTEQTKWRSFESPDYEMKIGTKQNDAQKRLGLPLEATALMSKEWEWNQNLRLLDNEQKPRKSILIETGKNDDNGSADANAKEKPVDYTKSNEMRNGQAYPKYHMKKGKRKYLKSMQIKDEGADERTSQPSFPEYDERFHRNGNNKNHIETTEEPYTGHNYQTDTNDENLQQRVTEYGPQYKKYREDIDNEKSSFASFESTSNSASPRYESVKNGHQTGARTSNKRIEEHDRNYFQKYGAEGTKEYKEPSEQFDEPSSINNVETGKDNENLQQTGNAEYVRGPAKFKSIKRRKNHIHKKLNENEEGYNDEEQSIYPIKQRYLQAPNLRHGDEIDGTLAEEPPRRAVKDEHGNQRSLQKFEDNYELQEKSHQPDYEDYNERKQDEYDQYDDESDYYSIPQFVHEGKRQHQTPTYRKHGKSKTSRNGYDIQDVDRFNGFTREFPTFRRFHSRMLLPNYRKKYEDNMKWKQQYQETISQNQLYDDMWKHMKAKYAQKSKYTDENLVFARKKHNNRASRNHSQNANDVPDGSRQQRSAHLY